MDLWGAAEWTSAGRTHRIVELGNSVWKKSTMHGIMICKTWRRVRELQRAMPCPDTVLTDSHRSFQNYHHSERDSTMLSEFTESVHRFVGEQIRTLKCFAC